MTPAVRSSIPPLGLLLLALLAALVPAAAHASPDAPPATGTPIMGPAALDADQITDWYATLGVTSRSPTPVRTIAEAFLDEGAAQGVRGDLAFAQAMLETGYLRFGGIVRPSDHNFSGLGACDRCPRGLAFPDPVLGVRAQIQHLYAYGDTAASVEGLVRPQADIRFDLVRPKGKAVTWERMGSGNWASDGTYAGKVLGIWRRMLASAGVPEPSIAPPGGVAEVIPVLATRRGGARLGGWALGRQPLASGALLLGSPSSLTPAGGGCLARWSALGAAALVSADGDPCVAEAARTRWVRLAAPRFRTQKGLVPGDGLDRLRELYPAARRRAGRWWLIWGRDASGTPVARLSAEVRAGVVRALWVAPAPS